MPVNVYYVIININLSRLFGTRLACVASVSVWSKERPRNNKVHLERSIKKLS